MGFKVGERKVAVRVTTNEESKRVQEKLFKLGYRWSEGTIVQYTNWEQIILYPDLSLGANCEWKSTFEEIPIKHILGSKCKPIKKKEEMLAIISSCDNLRLITDIKEIDEDATIYKLKPFVKVEKKTVLRKTYLIKKKKGGKKNGKR